MFIEYVQYCIGKELGITYFPTVILMEESGLIGGKAGSSTNTILVGCDDFFCGPIIFDTAVHETRHTYQYLHPDIYPTSEAKEEDAYALEIQRSVVDIEKTKGYFYWVTMFITMVYIL